MAWGPVQSQQVTVKEAIRGSDGKKKKKKVGKGKTYERCNKLLHLLLAPHALQERDIRTSLDGGFQPLHGVVEAVALDVQRVGARDEDQVGSEILPRGGGGADAREEHGRLDDLLRLGEVPAALRQRLVFDVEGGYAGEDVGFDLCAMPRQQPQGDDGREERVRYRAGDHERRAVARVGVGDDGHVAVERGDGAGVGGHVVRRDEPEVRHAEAGDGGAGAGLSGAGRRLAGGLFP